MKDPTKSRDQQLEQVLELSQKLLQTIDLPELLDSILRSLVAFSGAERGMIVFVKNKKLVYGPSIDVSDSPGFDETGRRASRTALQYVLDHGEVLVTGSAEMDERLVGKQTIEIRGIKSILCLPLLLKGEKVGAVYLEDTRRHDAFSGVHLDVLQTLAAYAAVAIQNAKLYLETIRDPLTQLYSSRYFESCVERELDKAERSGKPLSVLFLDVDNLKIVNDKHGHDVGDQVLRKVGEIIRTAVRVHDLVGRIEKEDVSLGARFGGDEFQILLAQTPKDAATKVAERIVDLMREATFTTEKGPLKVSVSIGVASMPDDAKTFTELRRAADTAMYKAKRLGRDGVAICGGPRSPRSESA
jgi:diguanylate cyclase (GGDEF)-like protein